MDYLEDPMKINLSSLALAILPLALIVGCEKKVAEPAPAETTTTEATPAEETATPAEGTATPAEGTATPAEAAPATPPATTSQTPR
jgi:hypothetical protein